MYFSAIHDSQLKCTKTLKMKLSEKEKSIFWFTCSHLLHKELLSCVTSRLGFVFLRPKMNNLGEHRCNQSSLSNYHVVTPQLKYLSLMLICPLSLQVMPVWCWPCSLSTWCPVVHGRRSSATCSVLCLMLLTATLHGPLISVRICKEHIFPLCHFYVSFSIK